MNKLRYSIFDDGFCDVCLYEHPGGFMVCSECRLGECVEIAPLEVGRIFRKWEPLLNHLNDHKSAGHLVPKYLMELISSELSDRASV